MNKIIKMASVAMLLGGAVVNALAFSGSNYMFSKLSASDIQRHNEAMEKLAKAREVYEQKRLERLDYINNKLREEGHAEKTFSDANYAMRLLADLTGEQLPSLGSPPTIDDFYQPSDQEKLLEYALIGGSLLGIYFVAKKFKTKK